MEQLVRADSDPTYLRGAMATIDFILGAKLDDLASKVFDFQADEDFIPEEYMKLEEPLDAAE